MSSRDTVIEFVSKLPEGMSLPEIAREIQLLAGIQNAREQVRRREGIPAEDVRKLVDAGGNLRGRNFRPSTGAPIDGNNSDDMTTRSSRSTE